MFESCLRNNSWVTSFMIACCPVLFFKWDEILPCVMRFHPFSLSHFCLINSSKPPFFSQLFKVTFHLLRIEFNR